LRFGRIFDPTIIYGWVEINHQPGKHLCPTDIHAAPGGFETCPLKSVQPLETAASIMPVIH
jgi:hypothetical protein